MKNYCVAHFDKETNSFIYRNSYSGENKEEAIKKCNDFFKMLRWEQPPPNVIYEILPNQATTIFSCDFDQSILIPSEVSEFIREYQELCYKHKMALNFDRNNSTFTRDVKKSHSIYKFSLPYGFINYKND